MKRSTAPPPSFGDQVATATGLAGMLAAGAVRRCCVRAGVDVQQMKRRDLERMLPSLETVLLVYLSGPDADAAFGRLRQLAEPAARASGSHHH